MMLARAESCHSVRRSRACVVLWIRGVQESAGGCRACRRCGRRTRRSAGTVRQPSSPRRSRGPAWCRRRPGALPRLGSTRRTRRRRTCGLADPDDQADADPDDDEPEPYCTTCGGNVGHFRGHGDGWHHFRGVDGRPGPARQRADGHRLDCDGLTPSTGRTARRRPGPRRRGEWNWGLTLAVVACLGRRTTSCSPAPSQRRTSWRSPAASSSAAAAGGTRYLGPRP